MLLAFDDTDGAAGGCTTHALFRVLLALPDLAPIALPRLVRLNPNAPWKTRGNGAVAIRLGIPHGPQVRIGELRGHEVLAFPAGQDVPPDDSVLDTAWRAIQDVAQPDASPAMAVVDNAPAAAYHQAVTTEVAVDDARALLPLHRAAGDGRGLVGALGAAAWPGPPTSYEFIAYRGPQRCGTPRDVDATPLTPLDRGVTFATWDPETDRPACIPHGPDPVLFGLRGRDPDALRDAAIRAAAAAAREPVDGWLLFATNHGSGDHVVPVPFLGAAPPLATVSAKATVAKTPERRGGHVFVACKDAAGDAFTAAAFAPTGRFRDVVASLRPGDGIVCVGALEPGAAGTTLVKLERLRVDHAPRRIKTNPRCETPPCTGKSMKSKGRGAGYRCARCGATAPAEAATWTDAAGPSGWHDVRVGARRHLHPLAGS